MSLVPYVVEQTSKGERSYDIFSRLLDDRIIMLSDEVNDATASLVIAQLLYLEGKDSEKFVKETGIDALAASFGTAHGIYKAKPKLDFDRIKKEVV